MHQAFGEPINFASQRSCDINLPMKVIANIVQGYESIIMIFLWVQDWSDLVEAMLCLNEKSQVQGKGKVYHLSIPTT
jgi:hypothetical protein